jgi:hypothetical protein
LFLPLLTGVAIEFVASGIADLLPRFARGGP